jgi:hypothetical protein
MLTPEERKQRRIDSGRKYRAKYPEKCRKMTREYMYRVYHSNPEKRAKILADNKIWRAKHIDQVKLAMWARKIKRKYGITADQYNQMLEKQKGVCALCEKPQTRIRLAVDHDHRTGKVRGLLCNWCNRHLGVIEKRMNLFRISIYLDRSTIRIPKAA